MPTVQLPSQAKIRITVNTDHVTHTVLDERTTQARLMVNMTGGSTLEGRVSDDVTLAALRETEAAILRLINTP